MNHRALASVLAAAAFAAFAACGGEQPAATQPANTAASSAPASSSSAAPSASEAPSGSAAPSASAAPVASGPPAPPGPGEWDKWSHDQKLMYMKTAVAPKMGALFHDFDAKTYAEPKCVLCHGSGAKDGSFKMPNPELPKLDVADGMKSVQKKNPKMFEFMMKHVEPDMAALLGEEPYDVKTKQGFGCFDCHTKK